MWCVCYLTPGVMDVWCGGGPFLPMVWWVGGFGLHTIELLGLLVNVALY